MIDFENSCFFKLKEISPGDVTDTISAILVDSEMVLNAYKSVRDYIVFTNKRIISINVQGITGKKKDLTSLPYSKVQAFSVETCGSFDFDSELELYFSSIGKIRFEFSGNCDIALISRIIGEFVL